MPRFDVQSIPAIWVRELTLFKRYWRGTTFSAILEPLIFLFGIGLGVGAFLDEIDGVKYVIFVGTGAVATAVIFSSVFPGMYNTFIARTFQKVYDGILATPTTAAEIMVAEALWIATRTAVYGSVPIVVTIPFGLSPTPTMLLVPPICFLTALGFTFLGQWISGVVKVIDSFSYFQSALITPLLFILAEHFGILRGLGYHRYVTMILRGGAHDGWATHINQIDARLALERIQVHHGKRNRLDAVGHQVVPVRWVVNVGEQSAMHGRMQGHDAMSKNCGITRHRRHIGSRDTRVSECPGGAATRQEFPTE
ncbi:MAG: hypothetical protein EBZ46_04950 [Actinobacteria bacterium]|nr:hypothetical protein [Actinomycetota bacterium]